MKVLEILNNLDIFLTLICRKNTRNNLSDSFGYIVKDIWV